jgi:hypothetical protein
MTCCFYSDLHVGHTRKGLDGVVVVLGDRDELSITSEFIVDTSSVGVESPWWRFASPSSTETGSFIGRCERDAFAFVGDGMSAEADDLSAFP